MRDELLHMRGIFTITCMAVSAVNRLIDMLTHSCPSFGFGMTGGVVSPKADVRRRVSESVGKHCGGIHLR